MEWNLFNYEEIIENSKKPQSIKKYSAKDYKEYIESNFKPAYFNKVFYNILISSFFHYDGWESVVKPSEQLEWFKMQYNNFTYHLQTEEITIFSLKHEYDNAPAEYSVFICLSDDDYILECCRVKDLFHEPICLPACAIWWYNKDGTKATDYLNLTNEESVIWRNFVHCGGEIINPKDSRDHSFTEWWKDRREYYCFYKLKLHKFGKYGRVFEKHTYDCFADYTFTFMNLFNFYHDKEGEENGA